eukprot:5510659-Pyramimonas_sp.AAC.1
MRTPLTIASGPQPRPPAGNHNGRDNGSWKGCKGWRYRGALVECSRNVTALGSARPSSRASAMGAISLMPGPHFRWAAASGPGRPIAPRRLTSVMNGLMGKRMRPRRRRSCASRCSVAACRARS